MLQSLVADFPNRNVEYVWVPSARRPKQTPATVTTIPPQHPPSSSLHTLRHFHHPGTRFMEATLFYTDLPIYYGIKELATSLQFHLHVDKTKLAID